MAKLTVAKINEMAREVAMREIAEDGLKRGLKAKVAPIAIEDKFGETGPYLDLLAKYGLDSKSIANVVKKLLNK